MHELRLEKEGYSPLKKEFEINNDGRIVLNMMLQKVKSVRIMTNQRGDEIYRSLSSIFRIFTNQNL